MFHILVVDDDKHTRQLLRAILENEHYTVSTAADGEKALALMDSEHIDLVVLDIMMPHMDGYKFTQALREVENNLPILMVSAKQLPEDKKKGFLVGTDDYMTKPIDEEEMLLRIKALLRRAKILYRLWITFRKRYSLTQTTVPIIRYWMTIGKPDERMKAMHRDLICRC